MSTTPRAATSPAGPGFGHDALIYENAEQLGGVAARFLLDGLAAGEAAVVAVSDGRAGIIHEATGGDPRVQVLDRSDVYRSRTPMAITALRRLAEQHAARGIRRVRVVGEVDYGRSEADRLEWQRYEAVVNGSLAGWPLWGLCIFDGQRLPESVLESARRTHPTVVTPDGRTANADFVAPDRYLRELPVPGEPLEASCPRLVARDVGDFIGLRHAVAAELAHLDGPRDGMEDFLLAVDEMTSNALRHGRPPVDLVLWTSADRVVCRITDRGRGIQDTFAGYGPAHGEDLSRGGMGLWLARQLCDHVHLATDADGASVRLVTHLR